MILTRTKGASRVAVAVASVSLYALSDLSPKNRTHCLCGLELTLSES